MAVNSTALKRPKQSIEKENERKCAWKWFNGFDDEWIFFFGLNIYIKQ